MCIAIYQGANALLPDDALINSWMNNPHGGGFAYIDYITDPDNPTIRTFHSMTFDAFEDAYWDAWDRHGHLTPFLIHCRYATHGLTNTANCHPFYVGDRTDTVMIHNGIIDTPDEKVRSDTAVFAEDYLGDLPPTWYDSKPITHMVSEFIGWSKLIVLTTNPAAEYSAYIVNEKDGEWDEAQDIWYSNNGHKPSVYRLTPKKGPSKLVDWDEWEEEAEKVNSKVDLDQIDPDQVDEFTDFDHYLAYRYGDKYPDHDEYQRAEVDWVEQAEQLGLTVCQLCITTASSNGHCESCAYCSVCEVNEARCEHLSPMEAIAIGAGSIFEMTEEEVAAL